MISSLFLLLGLLFSASSCVEVKPTKSPQPIQLPAAYSSSEKADTSVLSKISYRSWFKDSVLVHLTDTALENNLELAQLNAEIDIAHNEVKARKGEYLPFLRPFASALGEKTSRYTRNGAVEHSLEIAPGRSFPEPYTQLDVGAAFNWEADVWGKLRNKRVAAEYVAKAITNRRDYFRITLIAELASSYYELVADDNMLLVLDQNIEILQNALNVVKQQKNAAKASQLAVNRFEAQVLNMQNLRFEINQNITQTENRVRLLCGKNLPRIPRNSTDYLTIDFQQLNKGTPNQLLALRPDVQAAENELMASKCDLKSAKASFFPTLSFDAQLGFQAFNPAFLLHPEAIILNALGNIMAPLVNRNAIKAAYASANARQLQALCNYQQTILTAYTDVLNKTAQLENYRQSVRMKEKETEILFNSIKISNNLYNSARADYMEVLLTQRDAFDSKKELIEIKLKELRAAIELYRALGLPMN